jgi:hypothetical protein
MQNISVSFVILQHKTRITMKLILLTVGLLAVAFAGIAIKIWAKKDGKFSGTCASQSPFLNKDGENCGFCGKTPEEMKDCNEDKSNS